MIKNKNMKIAINGFGRIGRAALKISLERGIEVVGINDLTDTKTLAHLLKYDTAYGVYLKEVAVDGDDLVVDGHHIKCSKEPDPAKLPWKELAAEVVLECTGIFLKREDVGKHLLAGARKVVISAAPKSKDINTYVMGVNERNYDASREDIVSNASCTTNCYAPLTKILHDNFGVERGFMVTAHAVTNDQRVCDLPHQDLRRARSILGNIIPTSSNSDRATTEVIPELKGKLHTMAMRVPVLVGSVIYAIYDLKDNPAPDQINEVVKQAAAGAYRHIVKYETDPIVSSDVIGTTHSAIFDSLLTEYSDDLIKIVAWYDNEWGYSERLLDLAMIVGAS